MPRRRLVIAGCGVWVSGCLQSRTPRTTGEDDGSERLLTASDGDEEVALIRYKHVADVGDIIDEEDTHGTYAVPVEVTQEGMDSLYDGLDRLDTSDDAGDIEVHTYVDGEIVFTAGMTPDAAERPDPDADSRNFRIAVPDQETAETLKEALEGS